MDDAGAPLFQPHSEKLGGSSGLAAWLHRALAAQVRRSIGPERFRQAGHLADWRDGILPGMDPDAAGGLLHVGLRRRLHEPISPSALCVYSLLPWASDLASLTLCGLSAFREIRFDVRLPTGARGTPPVIHALAIGEQGVVGISARLFDYVAPARSRLATTYADAMLPELMGPWQEAAAVDDRREPLYRRQVDAPHLMKLALGLARIFPGRPVRLLYLFLEPAGCDGASVFDEHRTALDELSAATRDSAVSFVACSFHELWDGWTRARSTAMRGIVAELGRRYTVAMPI